MGIVSDIAASLGGCEWHTAQRYVNRWAETRAAYDDESERALDLSESQLLKAVQAGDGPMIRFHLATKGKNRGYVERTELDGPDGRPIPIQIVERVIAPQDRDYRPDAAAGDVPVE
jgi:hypothetical protein